MTVVGSVLLFSAGEEGKTRRAGSFLFGLVFGGWLVLNLGVWVDADRLFHQVTQHPPSLHPSISLWPTQPFLLLIPLRAEFIFTVRVCRQAQVQLMSLSLSLFSTIQKHTKNTVLLFLFSFCNCHLLFSAVLAFSLLSTVFFSLFPSHQQSVISVCVAFVAQLAEIRKPLLACRYSDVVRRRRTRTNLSSVKPALREEKIAVHSSSI